ncbi:cytochrome c-type biogenesis protein [Thiohalobacter sp.]|uniref:cytochrome c-type biogenesis protein n=1 Tax=Thiohalobacter sp. TaxID=2025948 RepID=UPI002602C848|nr:cytochrome c-type biogenesis protein [Thiohalobacter sp.]
MIRSCAMLLFLLCLLAPARAAVEPLVFDDPGEEARYRALIAELRCLVCQNQSLADSDAELAHDLRLQVHHLIREGRSDEEVLGYLVARYGDFVRYRPPLNARTWLLWGAPLLLLAMALVVWWRVLRRPPAGVDAAALERARRLLDGEEGS